MMMKLLLKIALFLSLIVSVMVIFGSFVENKPHYQTTMAEFYESCENDGYNLHFYGSSHALCAYNPEIYDSLLNIKSYNLANNSQFLFTTDYIIREAVARQKPDMIVVDLYYKLLDLPDDEKEFKKQYSSIDPAKTNLRKIKYVVMNFPPGLWIDAIFEGIRNHSAWKKIRYSNYWKKGKYADSLAYTYKGFVGFYQVIKAEEEENLQESEIDSAGISKSQDNLLKSDAKELIRSISEFCRDRNIRCIFMTSPFLSVSEEKDYDTVSTAIKACCNNLGNPYYDFNYLLKEGMLTVEDFKDEGHLNLQGAVKFSRYSSRYIEDNLLRADRGNPPN